MHGATFIVDACFISETLDENNVVIDIGAAHDALKAVLQPINYANLDESGLPSKKATLRAHGMRANFNLCAFSSSYQEI